MERYEWIVSAKGSGGHASEHMGGGTEDDEARAIALAKAAEAKLRAEGRRDWYVGVLDRDRRTLSHNPTLLSYDLLFFAEG
jgi:hypothetical protein